MPEVGSDHTRNCKCGEWVSCPVIGFELFDPVLLGVFERSGLAVVLEGSVTVLEEFPLPAIEQVGSNANFIAEIGDGSLFEKVAFE
jgi:hypothetical protein